MQKAKLVEIMDLVITWPTEGTRRPLQIGITDDPKKTKETLEVRGYKTDTWFHLPADSIDDAMEVEAFFVGKHQMTPIKEKLQREEQVFIYMF